MASLPAREWGHRQRLGNWVGLIPLAPAAPAAPAAATTPAAPAAPTTPTVFVAPAAPAALATTPMAPAAITLVAAEDVRDLHVLLLNLSWNFSSGATLTTAPPLATNSRRYEREALGKTRTNERGVVDQLSVMWLAGQDTTGTHPPVRPPPLAHYRSAEQPCEYFSLITKAGGSRIGWANDCSIMETPTPSDGADLRLTSPERAWPDPSATRA